MKPIVALVSAAPHSDNLDLLRAALDQIGIPSSICNENEPRQKLRWVMELGSAHCSLCVIADLDGRGTASLSTALDPAIPAVAWFPSSPDENLVRNLAGTSALVSLAEDPQMIASLIAALLRLPALAPKPTKIYDAPVAKPPIASSKEEPQKDLSEDIALYEQLETMMSVPLKDRPKPEPVQIQQAGLDFSLPLRSLMSKAKDAAQHEAHKEVVGIHYLLELDEPYASELARQGLKAEFLESALARLERLPGKDAEPVISDEVFEAVAHAKRRARTMGLSCVRVADFMHGLLGLEDGSVNAVLDDATLSLEELKAGLAQFDGSDEPCSAPFFAPSSLDQDSFYQFDPAAVRSVEDRLKDLPGFKKAAKRVAETRSAKPAAPAPGPVVVPTQLAAVEPPEEPEVLRISSDFPPVDVIEQVADRLLEGQVVAFPADVMFALAADATNATAIERLRDAGELPAEKPVSILINSTSQLKHLVRADLDALEEMLDELWPGPLTLVMKAAPSLSKRLAGKGTIAVRQPADNTSLAVLSMLGRPLAVTSFDEAVAEGGAPNAKAVVEKLTGQIALVIDDGLAPQQIRTTVVDMTKSPWEVVREGAVAAETVLRFEGR